MKQRIEVNTLTGDQLRDALIQCGIAVAPTSNPWEDWSVAGPWIEQHQVFLDAPHDVHRAYRSRGGSIKGTWATIPDWEATVSARVRTYPNPTDPSYPGCVGRGHGETPPLAICRAVVASFVGEFIELGEDDPVAQEPSPSA